MGAYPSSSMHNRHHQPCGAIQKTLREYAHTKQNTYSFRNISNNTAILADTTEKVPNCQLFCKYQACCETKQTTSQVSADRAEKWKRVTSAAEWHKAAARGLARLFLAGGLHIAQSKGCGSSQSKPFGCCQVRHTYGALQRHGMHAEIGTADFACFYHMTDESLANHPA